MSKLALVVKRIFVVFFLILGFSVCYGQPGNPAGDPDVPITGIEILLGLGGLLGAKKIVDFKKRSK